MQISGTTVGTTFQNFDLAVVRDARTIFPFPAGPISIAERKKSITMEDVRFSLRTQHDPQDHTRVLRVVDDLNNGLGSNAFQIGSEDSLPFAPSTSGRPEHPKLFELLYETANLKIVPTFAAYTVQVFRAHPRALNDGAAIEADRGPSRRPVATSRAPLTSSDSRHVMLNMSQNPQATEPNAAKQASFKRRMCVLVFGLRLLPHGLIGGNHDQHSSGCA